MGHSWGWSIDIDHNGTQLDGCLQYYVNAACQKLSKFRGVKKLPVLGEILHGEDEESYPIKYEVEYSGGPLLVKRCSLFRCGTYGYDFEMSRYSNKKKRQQIIKELSVVDIRRGVNVLVKWLGGVCLKFAFCLYPLVEELLGEHEMVEDIVIMSPRGGKVRFHAGKDAIVKIRMRQQQLEKTTTTTTTASCFIQMMNNNNNNVPLNMKAKMWYLPLLEAASGKQVYQTVCFGIATFDDSKNNHHLTVEEDDQVKEINSFFDGRDDPRLIEEFQFYPIAEIEMTKVMKEMPPPTAQLNAVWQFNHHDPIIIQDCESGINPI